MRCVQSLAVPASMRGMAPADEAFHGVHDALFGDVRFTGLLAD